MQIKNRDAGVNRQRVGLLPAAVSTALDAYVGNLSTLRGLVASSVAAAGLTLVPVLGLASTFNVDNTSDGNDGSCTDGDCSLREAVQQANVQVGADVVDASMINGFVSLAHGEIKVTEEILIVGSGRSNLFLDAHGASRIFNIAASAAHADLQGMVLLYGSTTGNGGAVVAYADLSLDGVGIAEGHADQNGGGIAVSGGEVTLKDTAVYGNTCGGDGGGMFVENGNVAITNSTIRNNDGGTSGSGFMVQDGDLHLANSTVSGNSATQFAGGFGVSAGTATIIHSTISGNYAGYAGGFSADSAIIYNSVVANNEARKYNDYEFSVGSLVISHSLVESSSTPIVIDGENGNVSRRDPRLASIGWNGGTTMSLELMFGSPAFNAGDAQFSSTLNYDQRGTGFLRTVGPPDMGSIEVQYSVVEVNSVADPGDGTCDVTECTLREALGVADQNPDLTEIGFTDEVSGSIALADGPIIVSNEAIIRGPGAAQLAVDAGGLSPVFLVSGSFSLNDLTLTNGFNDLYGGKGGAIRVDGYMSDKVVLDGVTISNSHAEKFGGGAYVRDGLVSIRNSTISGNTSNLGGGGFAAAFADAEVSYSTISDNAAVTDGGGFRIFNGDAVVTHSTINGNQSGFNGGGFFVSHGGLSLDSSTISGNVAAIGGGFAVRYDDARQYFPIPR